MQAEIFVNHEQTRSQGCADIADDGEGTSPGNDAGAGAAGELKMLMMLMVLALLTMVMGLIQVMLALMTG